MFQFRWFPPYGYVFTVQWRDMTHAGLLHSDTCGSKSACDSPQLFAAYRVLHRPLMPRHSPCALCSLTIFWNYAFSNLRSVLFPLSRIDNLFEIVVFLPKTFVLRIKTFEFLYFSHQYFLCSIFKILDIAKRCLQVSVETCASYLCFKFGHGGHKWTRTTDLTLIRRAL